MSAGKSVCAPQSLVEQPESVVTELDRQAAERRLQRQRYSCLPPNERRMTRHWRDVRVKAVAAAQGRDHTAHASHTWPLACSPCREQLTYQASAIAATVGVTGLAILATYLRFDWHLSDSGEMPWEELAGTLALVAGGVVSIRQA